MTVTASALDTDSDTLATTVDPSGFVLATGSFSSGAAADNTPLDARPALLDAVFANFVQYAPEFRESL